MRPAIVEGSGCCFERIGRKGSVTCQLTMTLHAIIVSSTNPMRKRQRVSSHDLYQSMSVLRVDGGVDGFEKYFLERERRDVNRLRMKLARLGRDGFGGVAGEDGQHAAIPSRANDAGRAKRQCRRVRFEDNLD